MRLGLGLSRAHWHFRSGETGKRKRRGIGRVVRADSPAGNAYLGGLIAGLHFSGDDAYEAALYATVSASFTVEQRGLAVRTPRSDPARAAPSAASADAPPPAPASARVMSAVRACSLGRPSEDRQHGNGYGNGHERERGRGRASENGGHGRVDGTGTETDSDGAAGTPSPTPSPREMTYELALARAPGTTEAWNDELPAERLAVLRARCGT